MKMKALQEASALAFAIHVHSMHGEQALSLSFIIYLWGLSKCKAQIILHPCKSTEKYASAVDLRTHVPIVGAQSRQAAHPGERV